MLYALRMAGECRVGGFSRQGTAMIKGVAILTMLYSHFFGMFGVRISPEQIQGDGVFSVLSWPAVRGYGVLCLELFAFVTGYGHGMIAAGETRSIFQATMARLKRFYPFFLAWCGVFVILCFIAPYPPVICPDRIPDYLLTMVGLRHGITDYWYISVFLFASLVCFPLLLLSRRRNMSLYELILILLCACPEGRTLHGLMFHLFDMFTDNPVVWVTSVARISYMSALPWIPYYAMGWLLASAGRAEGVSGKLLLLSLAVVALLLRPSSSIDKIIFLSVLAAAYFLQHLPKHWVSSLVLLGKYSACMWLNHRLIFGYWFADFFYGLPTPLNYLLLVGVSLGVSVVVMWVWEEWVMGGRKKRRHDDAAA